MLKDLAMQAYENSYMEAFERVFGFIPENVRGCYFSVDDINFAFDLKTMDGSYWWKIVEQCTVCGEMKRSWSFMDLVGMGKQLEEGFKFHECKKPKVRDFKSRDI